jgi:hypothetical protein
MYYIFKFTSLTSREKGVTGKSKVLHAIKSLFQKLRKQDELLVSATTGILIAAKLIRGSTIDSLCHFRKRVSNSDDDLDDLVDLDDKPISGDVENRTIGGRIAGFSLSMRYLRWVVESYLRSPRLCVT